MHTHHLQMSRSRSSSNPNGWVDFVARGFVGFWAGSVVGSLLGVLACIVIVAFGLHHQWGMFWGLDAMAITYATGMLLGVIWFLLDPPLARPWTRPPARRRPAGV